MALLGFRGFEEAQMAKRERERDILEICGVVLDTWEEGSRR